MRSAFLILASAVAVAIGALSSRSQELPQASVEKANEQALRWLENLQKVITPETYKALGFESVEEAHRAKLGSPLPVFMVRLDRLKEYNKETDPNSLLDYTHHIIFPVNVGGVQRTGLTLKEKDGQWQLASFGRPSFTKALTRTLQTEADSSKSLPESFFVVEIPALHDYFIARRSDNNLLLSMAIGDSSQKLPLISNMNARQVFTTLAPDAREVRMEPFTSD
jgi:hypothetical protein